MLNQHFKGVKEVLNKCRRNRCGAERLRTLCPFHIMQLLSLLYTPHQHPLASSAPGRLQQYFFFGGGAWLSVLSVWSHSISYSYCAHKDAHTHTNEGLHGHVNTQSHIDNPHRYINVNTDTWEKEPLSKKGTIVGMRRSDTPPTERWVGVSHLSSISHLVLFLDCHLFIITLQRMCISSF